MAKTEDGESKTVRTTKEKFGEDHYRKIGSIGGRKKGDELRSPKGFAANKDLARIAGAKGGRLRKRGKAK